jgi:hypothetical protein
MIRSLSAYVPCVHVRFDSLTLSHSVLHAAYQIFIQLNKGCKSEAEAKCRTLLQQALLSAFPNRTVRVYEYFRTGIPVLICMPAVSSASLFPL